MLKAKVVWQLIARKKKDPRVISEAESVRNKKTVKKSVKVQS